MAEGVDFCGTLESVFIDVAKITPGDLNERCRNSMVSTIGITFTEIGANHLKATMPVNENTIQPFGILHGGASLALIETLGSSAANLAIDRNRFVAVGQTVSCSHIKSVLKGDTVIATASPVHLGRTSQVWEISITNSKMILICKGQITLAIVPLEKISG